MTQFSMVFCLFDVSQKKKFSWSAEKMKKISEFCKNAHGHCECNIMKQIHLNCFLKLTMTRAFINFCFTNDLCELSGNVLPLNMCVCISKNRVLSYIQHNILSSVRYWSLIKIENIMLPFSIYSLKFKEKRVFKSTLFLRQTFKTKNIIQHHATMMWMQNRKILPFRICV